MEATLVPVISWLPDWLEVLFVLFVLPSFVFWLRSATGYDGDWTPKYRKTDSRSTTGDTSTRT